MDLLVADPVAVAAANLLIRSCNSAANLHISSAILAVDAVAPPPVKSTACRIPRRTRLRRKRRIKRKLSGDESGKEDFFFVDGGDCGGGFGSSGGGWNFNNNFGGGDDWDESSSSVPDPAFDFVYQVLSWIMLSNCLHFAFKKILRIILDADREKVPRRLAPIC